MVEVELEACRRMRKSLAGIRDLDPPGVDARLAEIDREIERLRELLEGDRDARADVGRIEIVPISAFRAA